MTLRHLSCNENLNPRRAFGSLPAMESSPTTGVSSVTGPPQRKPALPLGLKPMEWAVLLVASLLVLAASYRGWWTIGVAEAWGFATGGVSR